MTYLANGYTLSNQKHRKLANKYSNTELVHNMNWSYIHQHHYQSDL